MDCRRIVRLLQCVLGLAAGVVTASAAPPAGIGTLDRISITGNTVFSTDEIRRVVATHPAAIEASQWPQKRWMEELRSLIEQGYRNCGYAEAVVRQGQGAELQIQEGRRFLDGKIRLTGISEELAAAVRERLTGPSYPTNAVPEPVHLEGGRTAFRWVDDKGAEVKPGTPAWQPLQHGSYSATREKLLNNGVLSLLDLYGRTGATAECHLEPNSTAGTVDLVIDITNPGTEVEVDEFTVTGMVNHTEAEILTYLDLKPGKFTLLDRLSIERKLWQSGRFLGHRAELIAPFRTGDPFRLEIHVKECLQAPKLGEPFSESQLVLLKAGEWLTHLPQQENAIAGTVRFANPVQPASTNAGSGIDISVVLSPRNRFACRVDLIGPGALTMPVAYSFSGDSTAISIASHSTRRLVRIPCKQGKASISLTLAGIDKPGSDHSVQFYFGAGVNSTGNVPPVLFSVAPAAVLYHTPKEDQVSRSGEHVFQVSTPTAKATLDPQTGQIVTLEVDHDEQNQFAKFQSSPTLYEETWRQWTDNETYKTIGSPETPWTALADLAVGDWNHHHPDQAAGWNAILKLLKPDVLAAMDEHTRTTKSDKLQFEIPAAGGGVEALVASFALQAEDQLFKRDSTAAELARVISVAAIKKDPASLQRVVQTASRPDCGPVTCAAYGSLISLALPQFGPLFGAAGRQRLSEEDFANDLDQWLSLEHAIGRAAVQTVRRVRELDDEEVTAIMQLIKDPKAARMINEVVVELRAPVDISSDEGADARELRRFQAGLVRLWTPVLRPYVEARLNRLANPAKAQTL